MILRGKNGTINRSVYRETKAVENLLQGNFIQLAGPPEQPEPQDRPELPVKEEKTSPKEEPEEESPEPEQREKQMRAAECGMVLMAEKQAHRNQLAEWDKKDSAIGFRKHFKI